jgi:hypothetical protein
VLECAELNASDARLADHVGRACSARKRSANRLGTAPDEDQSHAIERAVAERWNRCPLTNMIFRTGRPLAPWAPPTGQISRKRAPFASRAGSGSWMSGPDDGNVQGCGFTFDPRSCFLNRATIPGSWQPLCRCCHKCRSVVVVFRLDPGQQPVVRHHHLSRCVAPRCPECRSGSRGTVTRHFPRGAAGS